MADSRGTSILNHPDGQEVPGRTDTERTCAASTSSGMALTFPPVWLVLPRPSPHSKHLAFTVVEPMISIHKTKNTQLMIVRYLVTRRNRRHHGACRC